MDSQNIGSKTSVKEKELFVDVLSIFNDGDMTKAVCLECQRPTTKMCQQCSSFLCKKCFTKSHKDYVIFKNHVLKDIEEAVPPSMCPLHVHKPLNYYCNDCKKSICMDCFIIGQNNCKNHSVVCMQEVNGSYLEELGAISPKVDETFRRLTKAEYDISVLLNTESASEFTQIMANIEENFNKLFSIVQKHKQEVLDIVTNLKTAERDSLHKAKNEVNNSIKKAKQVMDSLRKTSDPNKLKQMNLSVLLDKAKQIAESPCYLRKETDPLKVVVNEGLCALISDYIHLNGNANSTYKLCATADLGDDVEIPAPPPDPLFAPVLPKDVKQTDNKNKLNTLKAAKEEKWGPPILTPPQYRKKSESVKSLNSCSSDYNHSSSMQNDRQNKPVVQQARPFAENQLPKQLHEGDQDLIYLTHIVDPHNFYVQRACNQELVIYMLHQFHNAGSLPKPSISQVAEGEMYLAFNKTDNMWQRSRVVSIDRRNPTKPLFNVFCVDFGCTETVNIDKLRPLNSMKVQTLPPMALNCSLANCMPIMGEWTSSDSILIKDILDNKQAVIHLRSIHQTSNLSVKYECDVTTFEDGVSLAHALVFHERAKMPNLELKYPLSPSIRENPQIFIGNHDYKSNTVEEVFITQIESPDKFYVRKKHVQLVYEQLSRDLEQEYSLGVKTGTIYYPKIGMSCCVHSADAGADAEWRRAVVKALPGRGRVALVLVDSGAPLLAHWTSLRHLHPKFAVLSALCTECHLTGVTPLRNKWSPCSVFFMHNYSKQLLELHVNERNRNSIGVTLFDNSDPDNVVCINKEMIKYKFAVKFGILSFNKTFDADAQVITNKSPLEPPVRHQMKKIEPSNFQANNLEAKDKGPLKLEVKVLQYLSPSLIYISLKHQERTFNEFFEKMKNYYSNRGFKPAKKENWQEGDRCSVCIQSRTWRRADIMEIEGENAKVFYCDFGSVETVPTAELTELTPEFAEFGVAAIKCHLCRIIPASGEKWHFLTKEYLKKLLDSYKRVFITKVGNFKNKSMPVEIWVYHTIYGGALEPNKSEWRCLNDKIIEQGLAVPDKTEVASSSETEGKHEISYPNLPGSVADCVNDSFEDFVRKFAPSYRKTIIEPPPGIDFDRDNIEQGGNEQSFTQEFFEVSSFNIWNQSTNFKEDLVQDNFRYVAYPNTLDKEFKCNIIVINDSKFLELDIIHDDETTLFYAEMFRDMQVEGEDMPAINGIYENKACIALFQEDQRWYRAAILQYSRSKEKVKVRYVDYGNIEIVALSDVREIHDDWLKMMPSSVTVQLHGVNLNPNVNIDVITKEYTDTFLDKGPFIAKVIKEDLFPIVELHKENGELVYQNLIENEVFLKCDSE